MLLNFPLCHNNSQNFYELEAIISLIYLKYILKGQHRIYQNLKASRNHVYTKLFQQYVLTRCITSSHITEGLREGMIKICQVSKTLISKDLQGIVVLFVSVCTNYKKEIQSEASHKQLNQPHCFVLALRASPTLTLFLQGLPGYKEGQISDTLRVLLERSWDWEESWKLDCTS